MRNNAVARDEDHTLIVDEKLPDRPLKLVHPRLHRAEDFVVELEILSAVQEGIRDEGQIRKQGRACKLLLTGWPTRSLQLRGNKRGSKLYGAG